LINTPSKAWIIYVFEGGRVLIEALYWALEPGIKASRLPIARDRPPAANSFLIDERALKTDRKITVEKIGDHGTIEIS
jgi:hypothetical protein